MQVNDYVIPIHTINLVIVSTILLYIPYALKMFTWFTNFYRNAKSLYWKWCNCM